MTEGSSFIEELATRHGNIQEKMSWFEYGHLEAGTPRAVSAMVTGLAMRLLEELGDGPQFALGLQKLIEAKDCFVRQAITDRAKREVRSDRS